jgi:hypothetical protein
MRSPFLILYVFAWLCVSAAQPKCYARMRNLNVMRVWLCRKMPCMLFYLVHFLVGVGVWVPVSVSIQTHTHTQLHSA